MNQNELYFSPKYKAIERQRHWKNTSIKLDDCPYCQICGLHNQKPSYKELLVPWLWTAYLIMITAAIVILIFS